VNAAKQNKADRTAAHSELVAAIRLRLGREQGLTLYLNTKGRLKRIGGNSIYVTDPALGVGTSDLVGMLGCGEAELTSGARELASRVLWRDDTPQPGEICGADELAAEILTLALKPRGRWFCLEVKTGDAVLTKEQKLFRDLVVSMGGFFGEVRSVDDSVTCLALARAGSSAFP